MDMLETPGAKPENPIWMALLPTKPKIKDLLIVTVLSITPVAMAILMQKPALRQEIQMKALHISKIVCQEMADFWQILATKSAQEYQKVSL